MSSQDHNSSGLLSGVFDLLTREFESFVATATGGHILEVGFYYIQQAMCYVHVRRAPISTLGNIPQGHPRPDHAGAENAQEGASRHRHHLRTLTTLRTVIL